MEKDERKNNNNNNKKNQHVQRSFAIGMSGVLNVDGK